MLYITLLLMLFANQTYQKKIVELDQFKQFSLSNSEFTLKLVSEILNKGDKENFALSPFSIYTALSMLYIGALAKTKKEMKNILGADNEKSISTFNDVLNNLKNKKHKELIEFHTGNRLFIEKNFKLKPKYLKEIKAFFNGSAKKMDFKEKQLSAKTINKWISSQTNEKIKDLVKEGDITLLTKLLIINAVYFKSAWKNTFDLQKTREAEFFASNGKTEIGKINFMRQQYSAINYAYEQTLKVQVLELPYKDESLNAYFILPDITDNSVDYNKILTQEAFHDPLKYFKLSKNKVQLRLPKFIMKVNLELDSHLKSLGANTMYTKSANFRKISKNVELSVSKIGHAAYIDVNELGTELSAATAVVLIGRSLGVDFILNRPFLFFIKDIETGAVLFVGKYEKPIM